MSWSGGLSALLKVSRGIDAVSMRVGSAVAWLIVIAILISAGNATLRKLFSISSNAWLEVQWYLFGATFLLCAARVMARDKHVRVDLIYATLAERTRLWIDLLGHVVFLLPLCALMLYYGVPFAMKSFAANEFSVNPGGLILWPAKALIPLGFALLLAQAVSEIIKRVIRLTEPGLMDGAK
ncbi:TRAP transporter small permease subunit [Rhodobacteraceae bacterium NNCM2]|nr:TRAP transporter small permease subunit [Coraliihabitans acroporae]